MRERRKSDGERKNLSLGFRCAYEPVCNRLGLNEMSNAIDDGLDNKWDDGVNQGNYWNNYDSSGVYLVPESAGSVDYYPLLLEESNDISLCSKFTLT